MLVAARLVRWTLAAAFALVAAAAIVRGMIRLFTMPVVGAGVGYGGIGGALGYFVAGVVALLVAGELCPKPVPAAHGEK